VRAVTDKEERMETPTFNRTDTINDARVRVGWLMWEARDIGHGVESGTDEYVYRGMEAGKHRFDPIGGGDSIYLFYDEILDWNTGPEGDVSAS
jgi:hypothetical protein